MTFETREVSVQDGAPVELYTFTVYDTLYRYTSAAQNVTHQSQFYQAYAINRSEIESTDELPRNDLTIDCPLDFPILAFYDSAPPSDVILLSISRFHRGDLDSVVWWRGRVLNGKREGDRGLLYCENKFTALKRTGLRRLYTSMCPHVLYGPACRVVEASFSATATLDGVSGIELDSTAFAALPDGRLAGGLISWEPEAGRIERRGIKSHVGQRVEITHPIPGLESLATVTYSPGCTHQRQVCDQVFDNIVNYGGFPFVPRQNPMGNTSVF